MVFLSESVGELKKLLAAVHKRYEEWGLLIHAKKTNSKKGRVKR